MKRLQLLEAYEAQRMRVRQACLSLSACPAHASAWPFFILSSARPAVPLLPPGHRRQAAGVGCMPLPGGARLHRRLACNQARRRSPSAPRLPGSTNQCLAGAARGGGPHLRRVDAAGAEGGPRGARRVPRAPPCAADGGAPCARLYTGLRRSHWLPRLGRGRCWACSCWMGAGMYRSSASHVRPPAPQEARAVVAERRGAALQQIASAQQKEGVFGWPEGVPAAGERLAGAAARGAARSPGCKGCRSWEGWGLAACSPPTYAAD